MKCVVTKSLLIITLACSSSLAFAETANERGVEVLSPELRILLQKEMIAIEAAMKDIVSFNATGNTQESHRSQSR